MSATANVRAAERELGVLVASNAVLHPPAALPLDKHQGQMWCSTCHQTHNSPSNDGKLLRTANQQALCAQCHANVDAITPASHLWGAVRTIIVADFVMSLDNVIGVAGASHGNLFLLLFGLLVSIPLIIWSSQIILRLMERWPVVVVIGAGLLGWVAGAMIWSDPALAALVAQAPAGGATVAAALSATLVVVLGKWLERRTLRQRDITIE